MATLYRHSVLPALPGESAGIEQRVLPSTSPAHAAMSFAEKVARWRAALVGAQFRAARAVSKGFPPTA